MSPPLEWLWDQAGAGYGVFALDGSVVRMNETLREWCGVAPADALADLARTVRAEGRVVDAEVRLAGPGGEVRVVVTAILETDDAGTPVAMHCVVRRPASSKQDTDELIRALQQTLIPPAPPAVPGLDVAAVYHPAQGDVGGDFYDVFEVAEGDWCAVLGDVSGKGIEAAIVTSTARHAVRSAALREPVPSGLMAALNRALLAKGSTRFCTVALLRVQHRDGSWVATLTSGGHPFPLLVRHGTATRLGRAGSLLGMFADVSFHDVSIKLAAGDALVLYTDGVTEARNAAGEFYGEERMHDAIASAGSSAQAIVDAVVSSVLAFQEGAADDIALVVIRRPSL
ncbi:MAG TPA: PP2C family protein-serine/threonine phosphatase [Acidimicrobiales bacterium]|nr:PP2C family protein-serine/threonine phosphatase [Acidimicrobiales bacterium]